jgi:D-amino-acid dehydrogenase
LRIAVIGAGLAGTAAAYELSADGHEVVVLERHSGVGAEASYAPGGISAACPFWPRHSGGGWLRRFGRSGAAESPLDASIPAYAALMTASLRHLDDLATKLQLDYEASGNALVLFRTPQDQRRMQPALQRLEEAAVACTLLDAPRARTAEPAIHETAPLHAALHLPDARSGNCRQLAQLLKQQSQRLGATFRFGASVTALQPGPRPSLRWREPEAPEREERFDAVVVCAGVAAPALLGAAAPRRTEFTTTVLTVGLRDTDAAAGLAPLNAVYDAGAEVAIHRLGPRLRLASLAAGLLRPKDQERAWAELHRVLAEWFPACARGQGVQQWSSPCLASHDGLPWIGRSTAEGVWFNAGHGHCGWASACGGARLLADQLTHRTAPLDLGPYAPNRT